MTGTGLRVAVVHYHLRTGGVTTVMRQAGTQAEGLRLSLLVGEAPCASPLFSSSSSSSSPSSSSPSSPPVTLIPGLAYRDDDATLANVADLVTALDEGARRSLGGPPDLWHVHNHALGKNPVLTGAVAALARRGDALLLQAHDFAEDGRPALFARLRSGLGDLSPWPQGGRVHYALINTRDLEALRGAGVEAERLVLLANAAAAPPPPSAPLPSRRRGLVYPTRAIRRKNLGEALVWALLLDDEDLLVTRAPRNPAERPVYESWVALARELGLRVVFEAGEGTGLGDLLAGARACLTTSVAEGFGLAFLEPWLAGVPVVGRDLPEVTAGLRAEGLDLSLSYEALRVPAAWVPGDDLRLRVAAGLTRSWEAYGRVPSPSDLDEALASMVTAEGLDLGRLDEDLQAGVLHRLASSRDARDQVTPRSLPLDAAAAVVPTNRRVVAERFGPEAYGRRLAALYVRVAASRTGSRPPLDHERLLDAFLRPGRFALLRS